MKYELMNLLTITDRVKLVGNTASYINYKFYEINRKAHLNMLFL